MKSSRLLPDAAVKLLQRAAKIPVTDHDPNARIVAIDSAIKKIKQEYPGLFIGGDDETYYCERLRVAGGRKPSKSQTD